MIKFIEETFNHMQRNNVYLPLKIKCAECGIFNDLFGDRVTDVDTEKLTNLGSLNVGDILQKMVSEEQTNYCIHGLSSQMICTDSKIVVLAFSSPISINITEEVSMFGSKWKYQSHIEQVTNLSKQSYFNFIGNMFQQDQNETLHLDKFGVHANVKILCLAIETQNGTKKGVNLEQKPIYEKNIQLYLHKKYLSVMDKAANEEKLNKKRIYEKSRTAEETRKEYLRQYQQGEKRKKYINDYNEVRYQTEERKEYMKDYDEVRYQTEERKKYI